MSYDDYDDDCEPAEFHIETWVKARKKHRCCECRTPILIGERYQRTVGKWDGSVLSYKTCSDCVHMRCDVMSAQVGCIAYRGLQEFIENFQEKSWVAMFNAYVKARMERVTV